MVISKRKTLIPFIVLVLSAFLLIISMFIPYAKANETLTEQLNNISAAESDKDTTTKAADIVSLSFWENSQVNIELDEDTVIIHWMVLAIIALSALIMVFAFFRKPILALSLNILAFVLFFIVKSTYSEFGLLTNTNYDYSIGYYTFFIAFALVAVSTIWMFIVKRKAAKINH